MGSAATSFLWKLVHQLLPTEDRLARILPSSEPGCKLYPNPTHADLVHCLFKCVSTREMGRKLICLISTHDPLITPRRLLVLDFEAEASVEMALVWVTAQTLLYMWGIRCNGKIVNPTLTRAALESKICLLRETRFQNEYTLIKEMIESQL